MTTTATLTADTPARLRAICVELQCFLLEGRRAADEEIGSYPTPIPRCDAQFNHVYALRSRLAVALTQVNAALDGDLCSPAMWGAVTAFVASPPIGETTVEQDLRRRIRGEIDRVETDRKRSTVDRNT